MDEKVTSTISAGAKEQAEKAAGEAANSLTTHLTEKHAKPLGLSVKDKENLEKQLKDAQKKAKCLDQAFAFAKKGCPAGTSCWTKALDVCDAKKKTLDFLKEKFLGPIKDAIERAEDVGTFHATSVMNLNRKLSSVTRRAAGCLSGCEQ